MATILTLPIMPINPEPIAPILDRVCRVLALPVYYWKAPDRYRTHLERDARRWSEPSDLGEPYR